MTGLHDSPPAEPMRLLARWLDDAGRRGLTPNPAAMTLATVALQKSEILPSARIVLCLQLEREAGYLVFCTNRESRKAAELRTQPNAAAVFHWDALGRQARVEGRIVPSPEAESDAHFAARSRGSQLGVWASAQSEPIPSRAALSARLADVERRFAGCGTVPRPPHWGAFRLWATAVELWAQGEYPIHDRVRWIRTLSFDDAGQAHAQAWSHTRLQP